MTPSQLKKAGEKLHGKQWQRALARDLDISERMMRYYASGEKPIPRVVYLAVTALILLKD